MSSWLPMWIMLTAGMTHDWHVQCDMRCLYREGKHARNGDREVSHSQKDITNVAFLKLDWVYNNIVISWNNPLLINLIQMYVG